MSKENSIDKFLIIPNDKDISKLSSKEFTSFILPLEDYSVSFNVYFNVDEINSISEKFNTYVVINKMLHKDQINSIEKVLKNLKNIKGYFVEDLGLSEIIDKNKIILFSRHLINNHQAINYLSTLNIKNITLSNELTINEISEIRKHTNDKLYYFILEKPSLMYSKRKLLSNYYSFYNIENNNKKDKIKECSSLHEMDIIEDNDSTVILNSTVFCGYKYLEELKNLDYLIINLSFLSEDIQNIIIDNYDNTLLYTLINSEYYFLENEVPYKVGEII
ncbi:MAG: U32 family peptidase [Bacilli bacterium]